MSYNLRVVSSEFDISSHCIQASVASGFRVGFCVCAACFGVHFFSATFQDPWDCVKAASGSVYITLYIAACWASHRSPVVEVAGATKLIRFRQRTPLIVSLHGNTTNSILLPCWVSSNVLEPTRQLFLTLRWLKIYSTLLLRIARCLFLEPSV